MRPTLLLVTPFLAGANNGNWRTASRWARLLAPRWRVILQSADQPVIGGARARAVAMVALHARRSRAAIAAWRRERPEAPLIVVLTGTDLYRDLPSGDADTRASIVEADRLIVLQDDAPRHLPEDVRAKTTIVVQSARSLVASGPKRTDRLRVLLVAHLRDEKDPRTALAAWRLLPEGVPADLTIVGAALDPALAADVQAAARADRRIRWLGAKPHGWTRQAIKRAHVLVVPSRMEGGANVVVEACTAGTPVIGSRMSGNVGMLGDDYSGYFEPGDAAGLARAVGRACADRRWLDALARTCTKRARRMTPRAEAKSLGAALRAGALAAKARIAAGRLVRPDPTRNRTTT